MRRKEFSVRHLELRGMDRRRFIQTSAGALAGFSGIGLLTGCGGDGESDQRREQVEPPSRPTGVLRVANPTAPLSLDPSKGGLAGGDAPVVRVMYDGLTALDPKTGAVVPALSTGWEHNDAFDEFSFTLRRGVTFHDGEPFDATAVKRTFDFYPTDELGFVKSLLPEFREIDTSDPGTVRFVLAQPSADFLRNLSLLRIVSPKLMRRGIDALAEEPSGTGPYRFGEQQQGRRVVLEAFAEHWGAGPYFERLEFPLVPEPSARVTALTTGEVDAVVRVGPAQVRQLSNNDDIELLARESFDQAYLRFELGNDAVGDARVRRAVAHAIDRGAIVESVLQGQAQVAKSVLPPGTYGYAETATQYPYDPARARRLLVEAGAGEGHRIRIAGSAGVHVLGEQVLQAVAAQLNEVGLAAEVDILEDTVAGSESLSERPQHDAYYGEFFWANGGPFILDLGLLQLFTNFASPAFDELVGRMKTTPDGPAREAVLAEVQEAFARELPAVPMHVHTLTDAVRSDIHGYIPAKDGLILNFGQAFRA
jgi:ABC-type transport system substrate-binding protein